MSSLTKFKKLHPKAKVKGKIEIEDKKVMTGKFRLSYPALFEPKEYKGKKSWSISMIFSKDDNLSKATKDANGKRMPSLEEAVHNACIEKWGSDPSKWPSKVQRSKKTGNKITVSTIKWPFRDGDIEKPDKPEYENSIFIGASCKKNQPSVCDQKLKPIIDESGIKAGDYARATLIANAWEEEGSAGVSFVLMNVQKLKTGEGFGGGRSASEEFDEVEYDDEDEENQSEDADDEDESEDDDDEVSY